MSEPNTIELKIYRSDCATCGHPIEILEFPDGTQEVQPHYYCDTPRCLMDSHDRRFLGIVSSD